MKVKSWHKTHIHTHTPAALFQQPPPKEVKVYERKSESSETSHYFLLTPGR